MPRLSQLLVDRAELVIEFPAADVHVVYRPSVYTREFEAMLASLDATSSSDEQRELCDDLLSRLIVETDLTDDDDQPILSRRGEYAEKVPVLFLVMFVQKLVTALAGEAAAGRKMSGAHPNPPTPMNRADRRATVRRVK